MAKIEGAPTSEQMTVAVSNLLRYNLRTNDPLVPLAQELKVVEDYMYIQQMRFGDRVRYRLDCRAGRDHPGAGVPVAAAGGKRRAARPGRAGERRGHLRLRAQRWTDRLRIAVTDTGGGMPPEQPGGGAPGHGGGRQRQGHRAVQPGAAHQPACTRDGRVEVYSKAGCGTAVVMEFGTLKEL